MPPPPLAGSSRPGSRTACSPTPRAASRGGSKAAGRDPRGRWRSTSDGAVTAAASPRGLDTPSTEMAACCGLVPGPGQAAPAPHSGKRGGPRPGAARARERDGGDHLEAVSAQVCPEDFGACLRPASAGHGQPGSSKMCHGQTARRFADTPYCYQISALTFFSYSCHQRTEVLSQSINVRTHFT